MRVAAQFVSQRSRYVCPSSMLSKRIRAKRRPLRVPDTGLDLSLAVRVADPARNRHRVVVREHVAVQRIERRVVHIGRDHTLSKIVEHDDAARRRAAGMPARAARPRCAPMTSMRAGAPTCGCCPASARKVVTACIFLSRGRAPSVLRRNRPVPPRPGAVTITTRASAGSAARSRATIGRRRGSVWRERVGGRRSKQRQLLLPIVRTTQSWVFAPTAVEARPSEGAETDRVTVAWTAGSLGTMTKDCDVARHKRSVFLARFENC